MEGTDPGHAGIEPTKNGIAAGRKKPFGILRERNRVRSIVMFSPDSARALSKPRAPSCDGRDAAARTCRYRLEQDAPIDGKGEPTFTLAAILHLSVHNSLRKSQT
ncbi:hypothetical protein [Burkholderia sp. Ac-20379]|uniref:hypothetical protein n=1 Tax=Burkholderia sp. Ac-20379 TaxID=2703900 RepID=UPI00197E19E7|nr:hypothetical protein [Burkholderia sp. Ac-20379]MBN3725496.1 hypothetical protein [Burkholderia sp. Ac-20379]